MKRICFLTALLLCLAPVTLRSQVKLCMSYDDYIEDRWIPYEQLTDDLQPDHCDVQYNGYDYTITTDNKKIDKRIKKEVFLISIDGQLFINQRTLRDEDGVILPINNFTRALPYGDGKELCVVCYQASGGDLLDVLNIGLDIALIASGSAVAGGLFLAADTLLADSSIMDDNVCYLLDKGPNNRGKIIMTDMNLAFMAKLLRDDPVLFETYRGRPDRDTAAAVLPILVMKGLIPDYHHD